MLSILRRKFAGRPNETVLIEKQDAFNLEYPDATFDRVIAAHILEHLVDPVSALAEWFRVVKAGGVLSLLLPCDPGMLWRFGRHFGPRRNAEAQGIHYDYLQAVEHINAIYNLVVLIRHHFPDVCEHWYPVKIAAPNLNLFYICHISK